MHWTTSVCILLLNCCVWIGWYFQRKIDAVRQLEIARLELRMGLFSAYIKEQSKRLEKLEAHILELKKD